MTKPADNPEHQPPSAFSRQSMFEGAQVDSLTARDISQTQNFGDTYEAQRQIWVLNFGKGAPLRYLNDLRDSNRWVDRLQPQTELKTRIQNGKLPLIEVVAAGGFGKSLLAVWGYEQTKSQFEKHLWLNCAQAPSFNSLSRRVLQEIGFLVDEAVPDEALSNELISRLSEKRCLLVIDQLEALVPTSDWPLFEHFLAEWQQEGHSSTVVVTTRQQVCDDDRYCLVLNGFTSVESVTHLTQQGIQATWDKGLEQLSTLAQGHPLLLNLAASWLQTTTNGQLEPSGLTFFERLFQHSLDNPEAKVEQVFGVLLDRLSPLRRQVLLRVSVYRQAFDLPQAQAMEPEVSEADLHTLESQGFLLGQENRWALHPLVQELVKAALQKVSQDRAANQRALGYFSERLQSQRSQSNIIDLSDFLECFHHHCELGDYIAAYGVVQRSYIWLDLQGHYRLLVELYGRLVRDWQAQPPSTQDEQEKLGSALCALGLAYRTLRQYRRALEAHHHHYEIALETGDKQDQLAALANLGDVYLSLEESHQTIESTQEAIKFTQKSLEIAREIGHRKGESVALGNLGIAYFYRKDYDRAINLYKQSVEIAHKMGYQREEASFLGNLGLVYEALGEYQQAVDFHQQHQELANAIGDRLGEANSLSNQAWSLAKLDNHWTAREGFEQARAIYEELQLPHEVEKCDQAIQERNRIIVARPIVAPIIGPFSPAAPREIGRQWVVYVVITVVVLVLVLVIY